MSACSFVAYLSETRPGQNVAGSVSRHKRTMPLVHGSGQRTRQLHGPRPVTGKVQRAIKTSDLLILGVTRSGVVAFVEFE